MLWWKFANFLMLFSKPQVSFSSNFASLSSVMKDNFFRSKTTRKGRSKCKIVRLLSARIKIHQILVIFETNQFFFNFFYQPRLSPNITPLYFLIWSIKYFGQKHFIKVQVFEIFDCLGQNLLNSSCRFELVNSFSNFASFFFVITHNSPVNFKLIHFLLGIKVPHKSPNFESQLSSALVKICQIPHVIFQTTS